MTKNIDNENVESKQEAQMGLILLTWLFCHNLVKIHLVVIEILSFSCSVQLFSKGRWQPSCSAEMQKKKNQNGLMQRFL